MRSQFIAKLRKDGYTKIGAVGYCYGGTVAAFLGKSPELVDSLVIAHPGGVTEEVVKSIKVPTSWVCAEGTPEHRDISSDFEADVGCTEDMGFKPAQRQAAEP